MEPFKETVIKETDEFPIDVFVLEKKDFGNTIPAHWHDCIEFMYILEGNITEQINNNFYDLKKDDIIIAYNDDIHGSTCNEYVKMLVIKFLPQIISKRYLDLIDAKYIFPFLNNKQRQNLIQNTFDGYYDIYNLLIGIQSEYTKKKSGYEMYIKGYIYQLIAILVRDGVLGSFEIPIKKKDLLRLNPVIEHIDKNYSQNLAMENIAKMVNMSYYHFSRYFKKVVGKTFKEYIDYVRISEAEKLLIKGGSSISEVAYEVGYSNISSFNRVFKRVRGYTPSVIKAKTAK